MIYRFLFWIWFGLIFVLSFIPCTPKNKLEIGNMIFRIDYFEHLVVYFMLGFFFIMYQRKNGSMKIFIYVMAGLLWAVLTESVQIFVRGRTFNPVDMIFNSLGITLGLLMTYAINRIYFSEKKV